MLKSSSQLLERVQDERVVRIFGSSTFRDMFAERDLLARVVFPRLRTMVESRAMGFTHIDLRWGVTSEMSAGGQVIRTCLRELDRCRPFFICFLGERYGWHMDPDWEDTVLPKTFDTAIAAGFVAAWNQGWIYISMSFRRENSLRRILRHT